jgi:hypothetical protein
MQDNDNGVIGKKRIEREKPGKMVKQYSSVDKELQALVRLLTSNGYRYFIRNFDYITIE